MRKTLTAIMLFISALTFGQEIRRPIADTDSTTAAWNNWNCIQWNDSGNQLPGITSDPQPNAYDSAGLATYSTQSLWVDYWPVYTSRTFYGFANSGHNYTALSLNFNIAADTGYVCLSYSTDSGANWTPFGYCGGSSSIPRQTFSVGLSPSQNLAAVQVRSCMYAYGTNPWTTTYHYDVWASGTLAVPLITTSILPAGITNTAYSQSLAASGGSPGYTWSIQSGSLPPGLILSTAGTISGTSSSTGTFNFTARVTDAASQTADKALNITIVCPIAITTTSLPIGVRNTSYPGTTLGASCGTPPYTWSITAGSLPTGLTLNSSTGAITGTPTATGTSNFTVRVSDSGSPQQAITKALSISVVTALTVATGSLANAIQGSAYSATLAPGGGTAPYTWSISAGSLPAGLSLNASTGVISGTPTGTGISSFTVRVNDSGSQSATKPLSINVYPTLTVSTSSLPVATQGVNYSATVAASGGATPYSWSVSAGSLPTGLTLNGSTGAITGAPASTGTSNFTVRLADGGNPQQVKTKTLSISVYFVLTIATGSLPGGIQGVTYSTTLAAGGGAPPYSWSLSAGTLPTGMSLNSSTGAITGTPTGTGTSNVTVQVMDAASQTTTKALAITVAAPLSVATSSLVNGIQNSAYSVALNATGGITPYTWGVSAGNLPVGVSLNATTGAITGTPTGTGASSFTVLVSDSANPQQTAAKSLSLTVNPVIKLLTDALPSGAQNEPYSATGVASGGVGLYSWSISSGSLPAGLVLNGSTGAITGAPTAIGTGNFNLQVADSGSPQQTLAKALSITVNAPLAIGTDSLQNALKNETYSVALQANGGVGPYLWAIVSGALPTGLSLNTGSGVISGPPTTQGTSSFIAQVQDSNAMTATKALQLIVNLEPTPVVDNLAPNSASAGTFVTINGNHFGVVQGTSSATLNGAVLPVAAWSNNSIVFSVPFAMSTGTVVVTVGQLQSVPATLTIQDSASCPVN